MALTRLDKTGDNVTTVYDVYFNFGYLRKEYVYVYLHEDDIDNELTYTWLNDNQILLDAPVPTGEVFHIRRVIPRNELINDYETGAILREKNIDDSYSQALMILEEMQDGYLDPTDEVIFEAILDMNQNRIINLADAVDPQDAVNLRTLQAWVRYEIGQDAGTWNASTSYPVGSICTGLDRLKYICVAANSNENPVTDEENTYWALSTGDGITFNTIKGATNISDTFAELVAVNHPKIRTKVNNTDTNMGGADYKLLSIDDFAAESYNPVPDGGIVGGRVVGMDHYTGGNTNYVLKYDMNVGFDRAAGTIGDPRIIADYDDLPALQRLVSWSQQGSPLDEGLIQKEYQKVFFHPRSEFNINGSLAIRNARTDWDFNQCTLVPMTAVTAIEWEGAFCGMKNLWIEGNQRVTRAEWLASGQALCEWGKNEPVSYSNGGDVRMEGLLFRGGYHTWSLNSVDNSNASFIWTSTFSQCYFQDAVEYCFNFNSVHELSTTMNLVNCHARCTNRDSVTVGAFDYYCINHHVADANNEPGTGANWEDVWYREPTVVNKGTWVIGTQYITNGKGFYFSNVSGVSMEACSMDGGNNASDGTVISYSGQYIDIGVFHLEAFNHNVTLGKKPIYLNGDWNITELMLVANRWKMPLATDNSILVGGVDPSNKRGTFLNATILGVVESGTPIFIDCTGYKSIDLGSGITLNGIINTTGTTTAQRGIKNRVVKTLTSGTSTVNYTPDIRENGAFFHSGDTLASATMNITLDNFEYVESTDWNGGLQKNSYQMEFYLQDDGTGAGVINFIAGAGSPAFVGDTSYVAGSTVRATKISGTKWLLEQVGNTNSIPVKDSATSTYVLSSKDNGRMIVLDEVGAGTIEYPDGLPIGFNFLACNKDSGELTLVNEASGVEVFYGGTSIAGGMISAVKISATETQTSRE